mmetsp:Transcript_38181/g.92864  ORF Transcript_38181/g.92864 Transcript_38181/m.92864 type:complete len:205 (-) Transcript_38181:178-792(-)
MALTQPTRNSQKKKKRNQTVDGNTGSVLQSRVSTKKKYLKIAVNVPNTEVFIVIVIRHGHVDCCFVNPCIFGKFTVLFEVTGLVGRVLVDDVDLLVLEVTFRDQDDITGRDPDLLPHLSTDMSKTRHTVEAETFAPAVTKHLDDLRVLLPVLLEFQFTLTFLAVSLSPSTVLSAFSFRFRHLVLFFSILVFPILIRSAFFWGGG